MPLPSLPSRSKWTGRSSRTQAPYTVDVGYEAFLGGELFFNPEIYGSESPKPLPQAVDEAILGAPIDTRRGLYRNIVLSGGTTLFKNFHKRLQQDLRDRVAARLAANLARLRVQPAAPPAELKVKVHSHAMQRYAVWFGGSMLATDPGFAAVSYTKAQYEELGGARIARHSPVFSVAM
jgi:actin-related protein 3